jgi:hypothetical protein
MSAIGTLPYTEYNSLQSFSDLVKWFANASFSFESYDLKNSLSAELDLPIGYPIGAPNAAGVSAPLLAANVANVAGVLTERQIIPAGNTHKVRVLVNGPALVNVALLPKEDYAGTAIDLEDYLAALITKQIKPLVEGLETEIFQG